MLRLFISCCTEDDARHLEDFEKALASLVTEGQVEIWHVGRLCGGDKVDREEARQLEAADVIVLLVSASFLASETCWQRHLPRALERHREGTARVVPVRVRSCELPGGMFDGLQMLPRGPAIDSWPRRDEAWTEVVRGLRAVLKARARPGTEHVVTHTAPRLTPLLPYLTDRGPQRSHLVKTLQEHLRNHPQRPFVAVVHGDQREAHEQFLERLKTLTLPRVLGGVPIERKQTSWSDEGDAPRDRHATHLRDLSRAVLGRFDGDPAALEAELTLGRQPVMLSTTLFAHGRRTTEEPLLRAWCEHWNRFGDLAPGMCLLVFLNVRYLDPTGGGRWRRWRASRRSEDWRRFLTGYDFTAFPHLTGVVLPELEGIRHHHVVGWLEQDLKRFCARAAEGELLHTRLMERLDPWVRDLYREWRERQGSDRIPMDTLAPQLRAAAEQQLRHSGNL